MQVYVSIQGTTYGPFSPDEVRQKLDSGEIETTDLVCYDGTNWITVQQFEEYNLLPPSKIIKRKQGNDDGDEWPVGCTVVASLVGVAILAAVAAILYLYYDNTQGEAYFEREKAKEYKELENDYSIAAFKTKLPDGVYTFVLNCNLGDRMPSSFSKSLKQVFMCLRCQDENYDSIYAYLPQNSDAGKYVFEKLKDGKKHQLKLSLFYPPNTDPEVNTTFVDEVDGRKVDWSDESLLKNMKNASNDLKPPLKFHFLIANQFFQGLRRKYEIHRNLKQPRPERREDVASLGVGS